MYEGRLNWKQCGQTTRELTKRLEGIGLCTAHCMCTLLTWVLSTEPDKRPRCRGYSQLCTKQAHCHRSLRSSKVNAIVWWCFQRVRCAIPFSSPTLSLSNCPCLRTIACLPAGAWQTLLRNSTIALIGTWWSARQHLCLASLSDMSCFSGWLYQSQSHQWKQSQSNCTFFCVFPLKTEQISFFIWSLPLTPTT